MNVWPSTSHCSVRSETLPVEYLGGKQLCMNQYYQVLSSCRVPGLKRDSVVNHAHRSRPPTHITVVHNFQVNQERPMELSVVQRCLFHALSMCNYKENNSSAHSNSDAVDCLDITATVHLAKSGWWSLLYATGNMHLKTEHFFIAQGQVVSPCFRPIGSWPRLSIFFCLQVDCEYIICLSLSPVSPLSVLCPGRVQQWWHPADGGPVVHATGEGLELVPADQQGAHRHPHL